MKLELKHLAPYLPYSLECHAMGEFKFGAEDSDTPIPEMFLLHGLLRSDNASIIHLGQKELIGFDELFPILRPLSDLTKDNNFLQYCKEQISCADLKITHEEGNPEPSMIYIEVLGGQNEMIAMDNEIMAECPYLFYLWLIENHYDIFDLIEKGLAIDINTI